MTSSAQDDAAEHVLDDQAAARLTADSIRTFHPGEPTPSVAGLLDHLADELDDVTALREGKAEDGQHDVQT